MTMDQIPTSRTYDVFKAACMSGPVSQEVRQAAMQELARRGHTCATVAEQVLQIRAANPQVFAPVQPVQQQPYFMPMRPAQAAPQAPQGVHATLSSQGFTQGPSGQAYLCQYRTSTGQWQVIRPLTDGPCPPTVNLR